MKDFCYVIKSKYYGQILVMRQDLSEKYFVVIYCKPGVCGGLLLSSQAVFVSKESADNWFHHLVKNKRDLMRFVKEMIEDFEKEFNQLSGDSGPIIQEREDESVNNDRTPTEKPKVSDNIRVQQCNSNDAVVLTSNCVTNIVAITYSTACRTDKAAAIEQIKTACENALISINKVGK